MRIIVIIALAAGALLCSGCATAAGTLTGALTNTIDCPAQNYRANQERFDSVPVLHSLNAVILGPVGFATGPIFGFAKGLSLDIQWVMGQVDYGEVFGTYGPASIWRPFTVKWPAKPKAAAH